MVRWNTLPEPCQRRWHASNLLHPCQGETIPSLERDNLLICCSSEKSQAILRRTSAVEILNVIIVQELLSAPIPPILLNGFWTWNVELSGNDHLQFCLVEPPEKT